LVVALALIPEAISFSIIAGVDPRVGLFASFTMAVTIAIVGGRPAMISAATGSVALVIAPVARSYGLVVTVGVTVAPTTWRTESSWASSSRPCSSPGGSPTSPRSWMCSIPMTTPEVPPAREEGHDHRLERTEPRVARPADR